MSRWKNAMSMLNIDRIEWDREQNERKKASCDAFAGSYFCAFVCSIWSHCYRQYLYRLIDFISLIYANFMIYKSNYKYIFIEIRIYERYGADDHC